MDVWGMGAWMWAIGFPHRIDSRGGPQGYLLLVLFVLWFQISLASKGSVCSWCVEVDTHTHALMHLLTEEPPAIFIGRSRLC